MLLLALRLLLKDKGADKQHCLIPFAGSNLGAETFLKKMEHASCVTIEDWGTSVYFILRFQENSIESLSAF